MPPNQQNQGDSETQQWLAIPPPTAPPPGDSGEPYSRPARPRRGPERLRRLLGASRDQRLKARLRRAEDEVEVLTHETDELRAYVERLEDGARRPGEESRPRAGSGSTGKVDLNRATFEDLRNLGLTVAQSARLLAHRSIRQGYHDVDEVADVPGIPGAVVADIKARLRV